MRALIVAVCLWSAPLAASPVEPIVMQHILPGFTVLEQETAKLAATAEANCTPDAPELREGYH
ncbi:MAG: peptidase M75, partial [Pseudomonadota bacterium]